MSHQPYHTRLKLLFTKAGTDATQYIMPDLLSFSYTDKEAYEADELSLTLKDETGKWASTWQPSGGEIVSAYIQSGTTTEKGGTLYCGKFYVDTQSVQGSPRTYSFNAVSIPLNKPIRRKIKSTAFEKKNLQEIARTIAKTHSLRLVYDSEENPQYDRVEQQRESDLQFLLRLCEEAGLSLKVTDEKLVLFDQSAYEKKRPIGTITLGKSNILSWNFSASQSDQYKSVTVNYRDPKQKDTEKKQGKNKAVMSYTYTDPVADANAQEFTHKVRAKSLEEAKQKAKAKLRELNRRAITGSITLVGDTRLVAGVVIGCKGFGSFDGNFIIEQAEHSISTGGYTTAISLRRVNTKY